MYRKDLPACVNTGTLFRYSGWTPSKSSMNSKYLFLFAIFSAQSVLGNVLVAQASLQGDIDDAVPGDTVWVAPGDHTRGITVNKAITLVPAGPGDSRLIALNGSLATVDGLIFDGGLGPGPIALVTARSGLELKNCTFQNGLRGGLVESGAQDVIFTTCSFNGLIEGILFETGAVSMVLQNSTITDCFLGLSGADLLTCTGGDRAPADRCQSGTCGTVMILNSTITGGESQVTLGENHLLFVNGSQFVEAVSSGFTLKGVRLEMDQCTVSSTTGSTGMKLDSVSGFIRSTKILSFETGLIIGDGGCSRYSDLEIGGNLATTCDVINMTVTQPETIAANLNFWGSPICESALERVTGQGLDLITDADHRLLIDCTGVPVIPTTWGQIRARYDPESRTDQQ